MAAIPLDTMLWLSLAVFGLGVLFVLPIWVRNWRVRHGAHLPVTETDIIIQRIARALALFGSMSALSTLLLAASRSLPFGAFMALCGVGTASMIAIAFRIDAIRARRHR